MEHISGIIEVLSILTQLLAVILAFKLISITSAKKAWLAISAAILLMAVRRIISFVQMEQADASGSLLLFDVVGFITSVLMLYGVAYIPEVFLDLRRSREALRDAHDHLEKRVEERTAELAKVNASLQVEIAERRQVEALLRLDEARLETLWELSHMRKSSADQIVEFALEQQVRLTGSKVGWIGFMNEDETALSATIWYKPTVQYCTVAENLFHLPVRDAGVWADAIRERRPVVINDYSAPDPRKQGCPSGHMPLTRFMVIPVFAGDHIVAVTAVANKEEEYISSDARQLTLLMDGVWKLMERERAERALRESESLAAIGRAISAVAHDMKTPLIAIGGFTRLAKRHIGEDSPVQEKLDIVIRETQRLEDMVKGMLDFSRPLELKQSPGDTRRLIAECLTVVESMAQEREVVVLNRSGHDMPPVSLDEMRMKQVLINLVTNAIEASPRGGEVAICTQIMDNSLLLDVIDCGCGIPTEKRDEIFSPFFTSKKEGTGLGLPIVKKIVEAHQGYIEIVDNPQGGVTFRVVIPVG